MANQPTKYRKFVVGAASAALVASAVAPVAFAAEFTDVKDNNSHKAAIDALSDAGVITGYEDGTFKPNKTLTRSDVVKLMGKWLVAEGYKVPADYKTKPRFADLKTTSNDELLKMSALVFDNGVFVGTPDGKLDPAGDITRENMAIVLVRAFDRVHDIDLASYVKDQDFKKDVTDLGKAKAEARPAIDVLDFFDITNPAAPEFNPKATTTRGQFASFLYKTTQADFGKVDGGVVAPGVASVKAVNATTVEVTMKDKIENINSLNFTIDGLTVSNAAVKQTDNKTVVLTTAVQKGGEKYTVTLNDKAIGTFTGKSPIVPEKINITQKSLQGKVGQQVIVSADIGVKEAGVPVTFNVNAGSDTTLNPQLVNEAFTNADGIATYSYTRYAGTTDTVTAYPTGAPSVRSTGKVYWSTSLMVSEETVGNELANGSKKVYKIQTAEWQTAPATTNRAAYNYVNVAFAENVDVAPDKLVRGAKIEDTGVTTNAQYPSQVTTGGVQEVRVPVNAKGEATFTVTGTNAAVTPVVFVDADKDGKWDADELQAAAPQVKFVLAHTLGLTVVAEGVQNAAAISTTNVLDQGGRDYSVTLTDKDGKVAPEGTTLNVAFPEGSYSEDKAVFFNKIVNNNTVKEAISKTSVHTVKVGKDGKAKFTITGNKDGFATPTIFVDNGTVGLDKNDLQIVGEGSYFVEAVINNATLVTEVAGKKVTTAAGNEVVQFIYQSVDQNGKKYAAKTPNYEVSYQVTAQFGDVTANGTLVGKGTTKTVKVNANNNGEATLNVQSVDPTVASQVTVNASASQVSLPNKSASINFTGANVLPATYTGEAQVNRADKEITFLKSDLTKYGAVSYDGATFKDSNANVIDEAAFLMLISVDETAGKYSRITATKDATGKYTFEYLGQGTQNLVAQVPGTLNTAVATSLVAANNTLDTVTLTFTSNVDATAALPAMNEFVFASGATVSNVARGASNQIILKGNFDVVGPTDTLTIAADKINFANGTKNAAITKAITYPLNGRVAETTASKATVVALGATGTADFGGVTRNVTATLSSTLGAQYNGYEITFNQTATAADALMATVDGTGKKINVTWGSANVPANLAAINTVLDTVLTGTNTLSSVNFAAADLPTNTIIVDNGVTAVTEVPGVWNVKFSRLLVNGETITVGGKSYTAGQDFLTGTNLATQTANIAAKIQSETRFATATVGAGNVITVTEVAGQATGTALTVTP